VHSFIRSKVMVRPWRRPV